jgi:hypothetical protein
MATVAHTFLVVAGLTAQSWALEPFEQINRRESVSSLLFHTSPPAAGGGAQLDKPSRRLQQQAAGGHNLASAPPTVTISGFTCHPSAAATMTLDPAPIRSRPHYVSADGAQHLVRKWADNRGARPSHSSLTDVALLCWNPQYFSDTVEGGSWLVDSDASESTGYLASIEDTGAFPPRQYSNTVVVVLSSGIKCSLLSTDIQGFTESGIGCGLSWCAWRMGRGLYWRRIYGSASAGRQLLPLQRCENLCVI